MKNISAFLLIAAIATAAACGVVKPVAPQMIVVESPNLHCNDTVLVFSPAGDTLAREIPSVFLLHGYSGSYADWNKHMDIQAFSDSTGFRVICPDGFYKSWYVNDANPEGMQWRTFFWDELWPLLDSKYGLSAEKTFITGLSMGGHGAMNLFLDHPERFRGAGSMSGILDLRHSGGSRDYIPLLLGAADIDSPECAAQSAVNRLGRIEEAAAEFGFDPASKIIVVSCGTEDKFIPATEVFVAKCREMGIKHISMYSPAIHRWNYWTWVVNYHVGWFSQKVSGGRLGDVD